MNGTFLFKIYLYYFSGVFGSVLQPLSRSSLAVKKLLGTSFNLPQKYRYSYWSVLSGIKDVFKLPVKKMEVTTTGQDIVYDLVNDSKTGRLEFLEFYGRKDNYCFISSSDLLRFNSFLDKLTFIFFTFPIQVHLCTFGLFKKDRSGLHSVLKNLVLTKNFLIFNDKVKTRNCYLFSIYDTNSSFLSYCLMKNGTHISQITSEVPLYMWNKIIVTNEVIVCSEYQLLEIEKYKKSIQFDSYVFFGPESYYKIASKYKSQPEKNSRIGFYSTGGWVRKKMGHIEQGTDIEFFEAKILKDLDKMVSSKIGLKLVIYPHPRERQYFKNSESQLFDYYKSLVPTANFEFSKSDTPSNLLFDDVYIAVCYMTTLIFERVHAKRKSVIAYFKEKDFPIKRKFDFLEIVDDESELQKVIDLNF